jgi:hypothetical protein
VDPKPITDVDLAFTAAVDGLLPRWADIPEDFKRGRNKWCRFVSDWFYQGVALSRLVPRDGVDSKMALRHCKAIMGSFEPKHEHKEAGVAYLLSLWFDDVKEAGSAATNAG